MTTLYWQIAPELEQLRRQAERMLEDRGQAAPRPWKPAAALADLGDRYELQLQLPGVKLEQLDIQATRDSITVSGDRPATEGQLIHSEFRSGAFERSIRLPERVQHQQVVAHYDQGLLTLQLPKLTAASDYRVQVPVTTAAEAPVVEAEDSTGVVAATVPDEPLATSSDQVASVHAETDDLWAEQAD